MTARFGLKLDFKSYWLPGTGKGSGSHVDAVTDKDRYGCPFISGRMLKGLLRDAVFRTVNWNSVDLDNEPNIMADDIVEILFGSSAFEDLRPRNETKPGLIRVGDAVLDEDVRRWLGENASHRQALFRYIYSTAVSAKETDGNNARGVARQGSLRGQQVVVPVVLHSELEVARPLGVERHNESAWVKQNAKRLLSNALPLMRNIGSGRTRGLGRVEMTLEEAVCNDSI